MNELDEADRLFSAGTNFEGDYIYGGDVTKWRKAVNVMQLKLLLNLYKKVDDPDLKVRERINEIINNRPVLSRLRIISKLCTLIRLDRNILILRKLIVL